MTEADRGRGQVVREHLMIANGGRRLALSVDGDGPALLFVHGLGSAQVLWHPLISAFRDRYQCWNLDLRGHGASDRASGAYRRSDYASDVAAALDHIGLPTIGIGHSLGGGSLVGAAAAGHRRLRALYVLDPTLFTPPDGLTTSATVFKNQLAMLREFQPQNRPVEDYEARLGAAPASTGGTNAEAMMPNQLHGRAESLSQLDPECIEMLFSPDRGQLVPPALLIPLRLIAADPERGAAFRPEHAELLLELTPHAEVETLLGVGHQLMMMRDFDEKVRIDLEAWLDRIDHGQPGDL